MASRVLEQSRIIDGGDERRGGDRAYAGNGHQPLARWILAHLAAEQLVQPCTCVARAGGSGS
jgi:hypothetical protein